MKYLQLMQDDALKLDDHVDYIIYMQENGEKVYGFMSQANGKLATS
jgi:hypothetical protein